ncbi:hypothetical protein OS21_33250 [Dickeya oryzae]
MLLNVVIAFSDMGSNVQISAFGTDNLMRLLVSDKRLPAILLTTLVYVVSTLLLFNLGLGIVLAIATTAVPPALGALFRGIWFFAAYFPLGVVRAVVDLGGGPIAPQPDQSGGGGGVRVAATQPA